MLYDVFLPEFFKKIIRDLKKKYPSVTDDLKTALRLLVSNPELGKSLQGFGDVRKSGRRILLLRGVREAVTA